MSDLLIYDILSSYQNSNVEESVRVIPKNTKNLLSEFRMSRGQSEEMVKESPKPSKSKYTPTRTPYDIFLVKYKDLENTIDKLGTRDLVYYFREIAQEQGYKYVISNIKKDMAIMKRLRANFDNREICGMIEFLYESEQDYLDKSRLSPNILASQWVNTIYADMKLWVDDLYVPKKKEKHKSREWTAPIEETSSTIGEW